MLQKLSVISRCYYGDTNKYFVLMSMHTLKCSISLSFRFPNAYACLYNHQFDSNSASISAIIKRQILDLNLKSFVKCIIYSEYCMVHDTLILFFCINSSKIPALLWLSAGGGENSRGVQRRDHFGNDFWK